MNRLTKRDPYTGMAYEIDGVDRISLTARLAAYEETGHTPEQVQGLINLLLKLPMRLDELMNASAEGRLVVLPCKVGDTLWIASKERGIRSQKVRTFFIGHPSYRVEDRDMQMIRLETFDLPFSEFGERAFLTCEEAEAALRKEKGDDQR